MGVLLELQGDELPQLGGPLALLLHTGLWYSWSYMCDVDYLLHACVLNQYGLLPWFWNVFINGYVLLFVFLFEGIFLFEFLLLWLWLRFLLEFARDPLLFDVYRYFLELRLRLDLLFNSVIYVGYVNYVIGLNGSHPDHILP